jgi:hypothetical protein
MNGVPLKLGAKGSNYSLNLKAFMKDMGTRLIIDNDKEIFK